MKKGQHNTWIRVLIFLLVITLTVIIYSYRDVVGDLEIYGYPGIFAVSFIANATVLFPLPGVLVASALGAIFNPFWVAVAAGSGAALGELTGYLAGYSGQIIVENRDWYTQLTKWVRRYGEITILVMAFIPNPIFDIAGMTAGALKMPVFRFLFWCWIGKILKMMVFAYTGASIYNLMVLAGTYI
jgi:membrane protein YqaA with SNARE-associated domain